MHFPEMGTVIKETVLCVCFEEKNAASMSRLNNGLSLTLSFTSTHALYPLQRWVLRSSERVLHR